MPQIRYLDARIGPRAIGHAYRYTSAQTALLYGSHLATDRNGGCGFAAAWASRWAMLVGLIGNGRRFTRGRRLVGPSERGLAHEP